MAIREHRMGVIGRLLAASFLCLSMLFAQSAHAGVVIKSAPAQMAIASVSTLATDAHHLPPEAMVQIPLNHEHSSKMMDGKCVMDCHSVFLTSDSDRVSRRVLARKDPPATIATMIGGLSPSNDRPPKT